MGLRSPVLLDQKMSAGSKFGANGTPMAVLVDAEGEELRTGDRSTSGVQPGLVQARQCVEWICGDKDVRQRFC